MSWDDLEFALAESLTNTSLDEMILLLHNGHPGPYGRRWNHVRPVVYTRLDEIPTLLLADPNTLSTPAHQQRPRPAPVTGVQPDGGHHEQDQRTNAPEGRIADENEAEEGAGLGGGHEQEVDEEKVKAAKTIQDAYRQRLERKQTVRDGAAKKIQVAYLHHLKRKNIVRKGVDSTQARYWHLLRKRSTELEWSNNSRYYLLFRIPLAYILVSLDVIGAFVESEKKEATKRITTEDHRDLENSMESLQQHRYDSVDCPLHLGFI